jgi:hypothetical protein
MSSSLLYLWKRQYARGKFNNEPTWKVALRDRVEKLERLVEKLTRRTLQRPYALSLPSPESLLLLQDRGFLGYRTRGIEQFRRGTKDYELWRVDPETSQLMKVETPWVFIGPREVTMRAYKPEPVEEMGQVLAEALEGMPKPSAVACPFPSEFDLRAAPIPGHSDSGAVRRHIQSIRLRRPYCGRPYGQACQLGFRTTCIYP